jgi:pimeloyl-ACP methyl ester carboxylesterase
MLVSEYTIPGLHVRDHVLDVPLDWSQPDGRQIELFVREVVDPARRTEDLPVLCFLQGGPGGKSPRPLQGSPPWLPEVLKTHRVILPDQRGTGRSTRVDAATIAPFDGEAGADYLSFFRADSIVRDFEHARKTMFGRRWETLGQSYGGFLTLTYLSLAPEGLAACYVAGGLAGLAPSAAEVYRRTYPRARSKTAQYYARYPGDVARIADIADVLASGDCRLPDGDRLTVHRFQTIGIDLGMAPGNENVHWLVDEAFAAPGRLSDYFLAAIMNSTTYDSNPLFVALQESIYAHADNGPTAWAAAAERTRHPDFAEDARPLLFTGEMMFPWMFEEVRSLRPFRSAVEALARRATHSPLYDVGRLRSNEVPVSAIIYFDDLYVDAGLSLETAATVGNLTHWVTNQYEHDGIRQDVAVVKRLRAMVAERGGPLQ